MQRASDSIGALAAALAKAQIELVNPEKSLVATIREEGRHVREQTFRYAPLSAGLEITRRVLGQHEIATLQTTSIDHASGLINLSTMLAHAGRMDRLRLASMPGQRNRLAASDGSGADLCAAIRTVRSRRHRRRR
jgi:hypothetical protein